MMNNMVQPTNNGKKSNKTLFIILGIIAVIVISFILNKTTFGYELKAVGFNKHAAQYAGISVNKSVCIKSPLRD